MSMVANPIEALMNANFGILVWAVGLGTFRHASPSSKAFLNDASNAATGWCVV